MSLLMEALRKAEAAKRAGLEAADPDTALDASLNAEPEIAGDSYQAAPEVFKYTSSDDLLALSPQEDEPVEVPVALPIPSARTEQRINDNDDVLDDYLTTGHEHDLDELPAATPSRDRVKIQEKRGRAAAASMFEAKIPQGNLNAKRRQRLQILAGLLVIAAMMIGGGWWYLARFSNKSSVGVNQSVANYNLQKRGFLGEQPATASTANPTVPAPAITPAAAAVQTNDPLANPALAASNLKNAVPVDKAAPAPSATTTAENALAVSDPRPTGRAVQNAAITASAPADFAAPAAPVVNSQGPTVATAQAAGNILEISHSNTSSKVQPELQSAYNQLQKGNLAAANDLYQELATRYPNNRDALLGLASVQHQLGNDGAARLTYAHLLKLNPLDPLARTGMLQTIPTADPAAYERELLALRQQFPAVAPLSFALGNHYAKNGHWHEAQGAYFEALLQARREMAGGLNPDYAFNLAVSLEQLGQKRAALEYYKQAELLANTVKPGFDPMLLRQRLTELEQHQ